MRRHNPFLMLTASVGIPFLLGSVVAFLGGGSFYYTYLGLRLPPFAAPVWAFSPLWWFCYLFMGVAVFLVWQYNRKRVRMAVGVYCAQLLFLLFWPLLFFGFYQYFASAAVLAVHIVLLLITMRLFFQSNYLSGMFLLPELFWLFYLFLLNLGVAYLN